MEGRRSQKTAGHFWLRYGCAWTEKDAKVCARGSKGERTNPALLLWISKVLQSLAIQVRVLSRR